MIFSKLYKQRDNCEAALGHLGAPAQLGGRPHGKDGQPTGASSLGWVAAVAAGAQRATPELPRPRADPRCQESGASRAQRPTSM